MFVLLTIYKKKSLDSLTVQSLFFFFCLFLFASTSNLCEYGTPEFPSGLQPRVMRAAHVVWFTGIQLVCPFIKKDMQKAPIVQLHFV